VRAAIREQLAAALRLLEGKELSDEDVHGARKGIKKARATLRLLRDSIPDEIYRRENAVLRDAARPLSATRDAKVLIDAVNTLIKKKSIDAASADALRAALQQDRERVQRQVASHHSVTHSRRALRTVRERAVRWRLTKDDGSLLAHALRRAYKRSRRGMSDARDAPTAENLHEWRKQVKYLWHQLQLLEPLHAGEIDKLTNRLHKLSNHLGDDHDLAVLCEKVLAHPAAMTKVAARKFRHCIDERRASLQDKAFTLGRRVFPEHASDFEERFRYCFVCGSQCSSALPSLKRHISNHVVV
jgi:CHAD domain-containing protein